MSTIRMWSHRQTHLDAYDGERVTLLSGATPLSYADALDGWATSHPFRAFFVELLQQITTNAFRWETPPVTRDSLNQPFEFVVLDSPELNRAPDRQTFADLFDAIASDHVGEFLNLSGDALMIVPKPIDAGSDYGHLGSFLDSAPEAQRHALWTLVGMALLRRISEKPIWLSTAGGGVSWLHVRLDDRPKYYVYAPYRAIR